MPEAGAETVPLYPRRRLAGSPVGGYSSVRRGSGSDIASSRPYQPGDHIHAIDWKSSARLSSARGSAEFIVRERFSEEMPRVVSVVDRRPEMGLYPPELPWLQKPKAVALALELIVASALNQRGLVGYVDLGSHPEEGNEAGSPFWSAPRAQSGLWQLDLRERMRGFLAGGLDAPEDNLEQALTFLTAARSALPFGTFVFVLSDFTAPLVPEPWLRAVELGWDVVPVIFQDPLWEQSFPDVGGVLLPLGDPAGRRMQYVRLDSDEAAARRRANEARLEALRDNFLGVGLDTVLIGEADRDAIFAGFLTWSDNRSVVGRR
jgi:uncharacterized protein (DUF58 family)